MTSAWFWLASLIVCSLIGFVAYQMGKSYESGAWKIRAENWMSRAVKAEDELSELRQKLGMGRSIPFTRGKP